MSSKGYRVGATSNPFYSGQYSSKPTATFSYQQQTPSPKNSQRPTSAGATSRTRNSGPSSNLFISSNPIITASSVGQPSSGIRPSSAGHTRPTPQQNSNVGIDPRFANPPNPMSNMNMNPSPQIPPQTQSSPPLAGYARPKSAGAIRTNRPDNSQQPQSTMTPNPQPQYQYSTNQSYQQAPQPYYQNQNPNPNPYPTQPQPQPSTRSSPVPVPGASSQQLNPFLYYPSNPAPPNTQPHPVPVPSSSNSSYSTTTSSSKRGSNSAPSSTPIQDSGAYKLHYGYGPSQTPSAQQQYFNQQQQQQQQIQQQQQQQTHVRPAPPSHPPPPSMLSNPQPTASSLSQTTSNPTTPPPKQQQPGGRDRERETSSTPVTIHPSQSTLASPDPSAPTSSSSSGSQDSSHTPSSRIRQAITQSQRYNTPTPTNTNNNPNNMYPTSASQPYGPPSSGTPSGNPYLHPYSSDYSPRSQQPQTQPQATLSNPNNNYIPQRKGSYGPGTGSAGPSQLSVQSKPQPGVSLDAETGIPGSASSNTPTLPVPNTSHQPVSSNPLFLNRGGSNKNLPPNSATAQTQPAPSNPSEKPLLLRSGSNNNNSNNSSNNNSNNISQPQLTRTGSNPSNPPQQAPGGVKVPAPPANNRLPSDDHLNGDLNTGGLGTEEFEDDDEMDGKPMVLASRSHPEVSTTTGTLSQFLDGAPISSVDGRNCSIDSFAGENINLDLGVSTIPNQFCSIPDAMDLKKILLMSGSSRGGVVPSSSAVMDMYMVGKVVGVGSYGKVRAAWHRLTGQKVAIKTYDKFKLKDPSHWKRVASEIKIMEQISHPKISRLYEAIETPKRMHLIMECLDGGNLCSYVKQKKRLTEEESRRIFFQILTPIDYLHNLSVSHRDIKLENVLFADSKGEVKLIDFGFSTFCQPGKKLKVFCGTPSYMAPEIVRRSEYDGKPIDMWSMGILLYALLCGYFPFRAKSYPDLYRRIARGTFEIPEELSAPVRDLIRGLLHMDPAQRLTSQSALRHSWLTVQLVTAPDMDKLRRNTAILISEKASDDLDEETLGEIEKFGLNREEVIRLILMKIHCSNSTFYYLLFDVLTRKRKQALLANPSAQSKSSSSITRKSSTGPTPGVSSSNINNPSPPGPPNYGLSAPTASSALKMKERGGYAIPVAPTAPPGSSSPTAPPSRPLSAGGYQHYSNQYTYQSSNPIPAPNQNPIPVSSSSSNPSGPSPPAAGLPTRPLSAGGAGSGYGGYSGYTSYGYSGPGLNPNSAPPGPGTAPSNGGGTGGVSYGYTAQMGGSGSSSGLGGGGSSRPKSATGSGRSTSSQQRPLSAFATRR